MNEVTPERLNPLLSEHFGPGETRLTRIGGGQSNPTFIVDHGDRRMVLRKQPAGEILKGAHAIDREFRVMRALQDTDVPVPRALLFHEGPALPAVMASNSGTSPAASSSASFTCNELR